MADHGEGRIGCAVIGATGMVGQRFIERLDGHPMFDLRCVAASPRSVGRRYGEAMTWRLPGACPSAAADLTVSSMDDLLARGDVRVVFSALPSDEAVVERDLAATGFAVFTNASTHRMDPDVPLLIPEINADDLDLVAGKKGFIVANGNCSGIIVTLALAPLVSLGLDEALIMTQQAISGAGAVSAADLGVEDNIVPYIAGEEEKLEEEPKKTLGHKLVIHSTCTRVPVSDGHFATVHVHLHDSVTVDDVRAALTDFRGSADVAALPSAPDRPIHVRDEPDRPQPALDRDAEGGMAVTVGRLRAMGEGWFRFCVLGHNTVRGAAGQSILNAECAVVRGLLG